MPDNVEKLDVTDALQLFKNGADTLYATKSDLSGYVATETGKGLSSNDFSDSYKSKLDSVDTSTYLAKSDAVTIYASKSDLSGYVATETGKGLSSNDFTSTYKSKLDGIADSAQVNVIESVKVNNSALPISNQSVNIDLANSTVKNVTGVVAVANGGTGQTVLSAVTVGKANTLSTARSLKVSLANPNAVSFDGSANVTTIGVGGVLPVANGGTGQTVLSAVTVGKANTLSTARSLKVSLANPNAVSFDGSANVTTIGVGGILPVANGGTGVNDLNNITVGGANRDGSGNVIKDTYLKLSGGTLTGGLTGTTIKADSFKGQGVHYFGTCSTAARTVDKVVVCSGFTLTTGAIITVKFDTYSSAETMTLNVNGTGAIPVVPSFTSTSSAIICDQNNFSFKSPSVGGGRGVTFIYNGTNWVLFYGNNATECLNGVMSFAHVASLGFSQLGRGLCNAYYGYCTTAANTVAKSVYCPEWDSDTLANDSFIFVKFDNTSTAENPTLNVNDTGAFPITGASGRQTNNVTHFVSNTSCVFKWKATSQRYILVQTFDYTARMSWYIESSTAANTAAKVNSGGQILERTFSLKNCIRVVLNLKTANTASNPTLNINRTGAKAIYNGSTRLSGNAMKAGFYDLIYDASADYFRVISMPNYTALGTDSIAAEGAMWLSWS